MEGKSKKSKPASEDATRDSSPLPALSRRTSGRDTRIHVSVGSSSSRTPDGNLGGDKPRRKKSTEDILRRRTEPDLTILEEPTTLDHKSFIQNVFGTVAFKMVEWLTPRNLERLARSQGDASESPENLPNIPFSTPSPEAQITTIPTKQKDRRARPLRKQDEHEKSQDAKLDQQSTFTHHDLSQTSAAVKPQAKASQEPEGNVSEPKPSIEPTQRSNLASNRHKRSYEIPRSREILNKTSRLSDPSTDVTPFPPQGFIPTSKRRPSRQTLITSPKMQIAQLAPVLHELSPPADSLTESSDSTEHSQEDTSSEDQPKEATKTPTTESDDVPSPKTTLPAISMPQSLPNLSLETVEFLCRIMDIEGINERHFLSPRMVPPRISCNLRRSQRQRPQTIQDIMDTTKQWHSFIEQVFFDALSRPSSLIKSFSDDSATLFDTQTMWFLMLKLTRAAPSVVLDSLWNAAGTLFRPPERLEEAYDWTKDGNHDDSSAQHSVSNHDAAQVINICLHALVAVLPLVTDARQLANMSRIRSYGLAMLGRESAFLEPLALCLQYEDAFTNELAVRLARRIFSVIPIRRRFTELLDLQNGVRAEDHRDSDVLEIVLGTLKYLDSGAPPAINFSDQERDMHEKRVPTLLLDWARTIMLQDWQGSAEVPSDGPFGGALAMMAAICKQFLLLVRMLLTI